MILKIKSERLFIEIREDNEKQMHLYGEWESNFYIYENGDLKRKNFINKFYVDEIIFGNQKILGEKMLNRKNMKKFILFLIDEAKKNCWEIIWPDWAIKFANKIKN